MAESFATNEAIQKVIRKAHATDATILESNTSLKVLSFLAFTTERITESRLAELSKLLDDATVYPPDIESVRSRSDALVHAVNKMRNQQTTA